MKSNTATKAIVKTKATARCDEIHSPLGRTDDAERRPVNHGIHDDPDGPAPFSRRPKPSSSHQSHLRRPTEPSSPQVRAPAKSTTNGGTFRRACYVPGGKESGSRPQILAPPMEHLQIGRISTICTRLNASNDVPRIVANDEPDSRGDGGQQGALGRATTMAPQQPNSCEDEMPRRLTLTAQPIPPTVVVVNTPPSPKTLPRAHSTTKYDSRSTKGRIWPTDAALAFG
ncbi:hypothetical protein DFP72DRAFT_1094563 [Ephemerocybe angulata]|uniref:Uncharacterized protein n=1 Tax=Ephemerocybe angulata TaxID=980116 RepID=A0A8H6LUL4_9AGAR|nr:hypothetical protein DFP72DRAFT_1094563 [Tulosesus angulatus]